jgi:pimeloyl-ACP methyl ester carboxylesterase
MTTFVLVHGAFHGGWCWRRVARRLRASGHRVFAPTLCGPARRTPAPARDVDLGTNVRDVIALIERRRLDEVVLVGHSYGGVVGAWVADTAPGRIACLICVDSPLPVSGRSIVDTHPDGRDWLRTVVDIDGRPHIAVPDSDVSLFGVTDQRDIRWLRSRLTPQPVPTICQPLRLSGALAEVRKCYIRCRFPGPAPDPAFVERIKADPGWDFRILPAAHDAMITAPAQLAALVQELGAAPPPPDRDSPAQRP